MTSIITAPGLVSISGSKPTIHDTGVVRWNGQTQQLEVMGSGSTWHVLYESSTTIDFDVDTKMLLGWVRQRIIEEAKLKEYCEKHPGLKDVKEKYDIMLALIHQKNEDK